MIDRLRWLHISDFHFVADRDEFSQRIATEALLDDILARSAGQIPLAFVVVTGDVAFSGKKSEYQRASDFLSETASRLGVPQQRFFFVPGNHDVERSRQRLAYAGARSIVTSQTEVDLLLGSNSDLEPVLARQSEFWAFLDAFTRGQVRTLTPDGLAYVATLVVGGLRLAILGLNSAWLCGADAEEMKLVIGERQIIGALKLADASNPHLKIALAHHPVEWLAEWDQVSCRSRLLPAVHVYQRGHLHMDDVSLSASPERPCLSIAAGSGHATRFYANSYNMIDLDLAASKCVVRPFGYDASQARYLQRPKWPPRS